MTWVGAGMTEAGDESDGTPSKRALAQKERMYYARWT